ncbi:reverse transcriptase domain-containing protein [Paracraurococcus lichenis]|uniref:Reverse transcriptase domain-containing protein n=1 Tax=Paracraurococcus lichenis TaxID=3064888 RepID=A0ABT9EE36_9PROT|nr:reverse transcriptase domain-containing protein [Paracraurococcus sp. LOR1-02]MDO9714275.1 reverse transcriptase domain-containing protein [Paracraurococcus sp. LOR1-02]
MARTHRDRAFASLHHVLDLEWMLEAYRTTRKDGAAGIDGIAAADYAENLEANLLDLLARIKSGRYQAPPVRRSYIPKPDGSQRPLGIPTFEDKVAQRATVMLLEAIYEQDFLPCSYGFRPGRSAHDALHDLRAAFMTQGLRWVLDIDIKRYFDTIPHEQLRSFLDRRVVDGVVRRMIDKWLKAGVLENGALTRTTEGTPQGGVISPPTILQNTTRRVGWVWSGYAVSWLDPKYDVHVLSVDLGPLHQQTDQLAALLPIRCSKTILNSSGKLFEPPDDERQGTSLCGFVAHGIGLRLPPLDPLSKACKPWFKLRFFNQPFGVAVDQSVHAAP